MKTKLGISVGLLAGFVYLMGAISSYTVVALVVGYILLCETDVWLRKEAVKAVVIFLIFSFINLVIGLVPDIFNVVDDLFNIFNGSFNSLAFIAFINRVILFVRTAVYFVEGVIVLALTCMAFMQKSIKLPVIDDMIEKCMK